MARQRHALNPSKARTDAKAMESLLAGSKASRGPSSMRPHLRMGLLTALSVILLSLSFAPFDVWLGRWVSYLAYVALAPWALSLAAGRDHPRWVLAWSYLAGLMFWGGNLYWLWWITLPGYFALAVYLAVWWWAAGWLLRAAMARRVPAWIVLPVAWVAMEYARAWCISGFPWFFLAHSQYAQVRLIQIADTTGQYGVSFFVALVNGVVIDLLSPVVFPQAGRRRVPGRWAFAGVAVASMTLAGLLGYGVWRVRQHPKVTEPGPVVGIAQQAFPITLGGRNASEEKILQDHVDITRERLADAGCDLVIWPETVLPMWMNKEVRDVDLAGEGEADLRALTGMIYGRSAAKAMSREQMVLRLREVLHDGAKFRLSDGSIHTIVPVRRKLERLAALVKKLDCAFVVGATTGHRNPDPIDPWDRWVMRNSALQFDRLGHEIQVYSKQHLVPFSECVPFKKSWLWLHRILRTLIPEGMPQLEPGSAQTVFQIPRRSGSRVEWRAACAICFEGTFARVCRRLIRRGDRKAADILVNISNDGWFVWKWGKGRYRGSSEHGQHLAQYCFRAVENRVPVVRAVNTGISASIDSNGRIVAVLQADRRTRTMIPGTLLLGGRARRDQEYLSFHGPRVLVDARRSLYSEYGDVFALVLCAAALSLILWLILLRRREKHEVTKS